MRRIVKKYLQMRMIIDIICAKIQEFHILFNNEPMNISDFTCGAKMRLLDFGQTPLQYRRKLLSLGITQGVIIKVQQIAPLGCPIQVEVRGTSLALRKEDARFMIWETAECM